MTDSPMPLAARQAPKKLEDFAGQPHLLGPGKMLRRLLEADMIPYTYSLFYNGGYMFPELILTTIGSAIICTFVFEAMKIDVNAKSSDKLKETAEENLSQDEPKTEE